MTARTTPDVTLLFTAADRESPTPAGNKRTRTALRWIVRALGAATLVAILCSVVVVLTVPGAAAAVDECADVEVIFARGTFEPPGIGATGQGFIDALRARLPDQSLTVHAVDYPASLDFPVPQTASSTSSTGSARYPNAAPPPTSSWVATHKVQP